MYSMSLFVKELQSWYQNMPQTPNLQPTVMALVEDIEYLYYENQNVSKYVQSRIRNTN